MGVPVVFPSANSGADWNCRSWWVWVSLFGDAAAAKRSLIACLMSPSNVFGCGSREIDNPNGQKMWSTCVLELVHHWAMRIWGPWLDLFFRKLPCKPTRSSPSRAQVAMISSDVCVVMMVTSSLSVSYWWSVIVNGGVQWYLFFWILSSLEDGSNSNEKRHHHDGACMWLCWLYRKVSPHMTKPLFDTPHVSDCYPPSWFR